MAGVAVVQDAQTPIASGPITVTTGSAPDIKNCLIVLVWGSTTGALTDGATYPYTWTKLKNVTFATASCEVWKGVGGWGNGSTVAVTVPGPGSGVGAVIMEISGAGTNPIITNILTGGHANYPNATPYSIAQTPSRNASLLISFYATQNAPALDDGSTGPLSWTQLNWPTSGSYAYGLVNYSTGMQAQAASGIGETTGGVTDLAMLALEIEPGPVFNPVNSGIIAGGALPASSVWTALATDGAGNWIAISDTSTNTAISNNNGATWTAGGALATEMSSLATDGLGNWVAVAFNGNATAISTNNGASWTATGNLPASTTWGNVVTDGAGNWAVGKLTTAGAAYSTNNGTTWTAANVAGWSGTSMKAMATDKKGHWVATTSGTQPAVSTNGGQTWTNGGAMSSLTWASLATDGKGTWIALSNNSVDSAFSLDNGNTWTAGGSTTASTTSAWGVGFATDGNGNWLAISGVNSVATFSTNGGQSWQSFGTSLGDAFALVADSNGNWITVSNGNGSGTKANYLLTVVNATQLPYATASRIATTFSSITATPQKAGNGYVIFFGVGSGNSSAPVTSISGGGCGTSWTKVAGGWDATETQDCECWVGNIATTGSQAITMAYAGGGTMYVLAQEFTIGVPATWTTVGGAQFNHSTSQAAPIVTATASGLYVCTIISGGSTLTGAITPGYSSWTPNAGEQHVAVWGIGLGAGKLQPTVNHSGGADTRNYAAGMIYPAALPPYNPAGFRQPYTQAVRRAALYMKRAGGLFAPKDADERLVVPPVIRPVGLPRVILAR
jgi:hypothetical protein